MARLNKEFYEAAAGLQNNSTAQNFRMALGAFRDELLEELSEKKGHDDMLRAQGKIQVLKTIILEFDSADDAMRRMKKNSEGGGPSIGKIT